MAKDAWGPLAGLIGQWEGDKGVDISYHNEKGAIGETPYREVITFKPFGPVENGLQTLMGLDYRMAAYKNDEESPFHTEIGYWLWDAANEQVMRCFMVPRGSVVIAGGHVKADATEYVLGAELGSKTYGVLSNQYLDTNAQTILYDCTITVGDGEFSYDSTTTYKHYRSDDLILHTDRNTLTRVEDFAV